MLYICVDGTGVPMVPAETAGRHGKGEDGTATTREVKLCCCFTQTTTDDKGRAVRDPRLVVVPGHLRPRRAVRRPDGRRGPPPRRRPHPPAGRSWATAPPGSGTWPRNTSPRPPRSWICTTPESTCTTWPGCWSSCCGDGRQAWLEQRLTDLDDGDIPAICAAARVFPLAGKKARDLETALGYFEHNAHRMRYSDFRDQGMFVGSGAVEGRLQIHRRPALQAVRDEVDHLRRRRCPDPALPGSQRPLGTDSRRPARGLSRAGPGQHNQKQRPRSSY